ncbi:MAG: single-stranded DNA-binding protein [Patescibacteria group bacterium]|nr:single-stranded DNA-binding protein [Patescibacteria group bacterium]
MTRSVNLAIIVGNLTRDPEMRYTPGGHAVTSFSVATNRSWVSEGQTHDEVDYHNVVAWNKLAELCNQFLSKGRKVYIQGRIQTRSWEDQSGVKKYRTEIVAEDMVILDSKKDRGEGLGEIGETAKEKSIKNAEKDTGGEPSSPVAQGEPPEPELKSEEENVDVEEIPF